MEEPSSPPAETPVSSEPASETVFSPVPSPIQWYQPPRLGIIHLLAWTSVAALLMKFNLVIEKFQTRPPNSPALFELIVKLIVAGNSIIAGAVLTGTAVFWIDRFRRKPGLIQPGHWIVAIIGLGIPVFLFLQFLAASLGDDRSHYDTIFLCYSARDAVMGVALGCGAWRLLGPRHWKWGLGFLCTEYFGHALYFGVIAIEVSPALRRIAWIIRIGGSLNEINKLLHCFLAAVAVLLTLVNIVDLCKGPRRDWLHWLGAVSPIVLVLVDITWLVAYELLVRPLQTSF